MNDYFLLIIWIVGLIINSRKLILNLRTKGGCKECRRCKINYSLTYVGIFVLLLVHELENIGVIHF